MQKGRPATGRPFSMGGSSNGGKAIRTLWCKTMFGLGCCQESFPAFIICRIINNLANLSPTNSGFYRFLSVPSTTPRFCPTCPRNRPQTPSPSSQIPPTPPRPSRPHEIPPACSAAPGANSKTPPPPPPASPVAPGTTPAQTPGTVPTSPPPPPARTTGS